MKIKNFQYARKSEDFLHTKNQRIFAEMKKKIAIIISTYNQNKLLIRCIESIKKKTNYTNYKIFFIDDGSKISIGKKVKKKFPWVQVRINEKNRGFSVSYNLGIKMALKEYNPDYILLLNDDCEIIQKDWLRKLIEIGEQDEKIGILGCRVIYPDGSLQWFADNNKTHLFDKPGIFLEKNLLRLQEVDDIFGAVFLIKRKVIEKIGFLDEKFSPFYGEETDFCFRTSKAGFKNIYLDDVKIIHHRNQSIRLLSEDCVWFIRKKNSIRLEWLNFGFFRILKLGAVHFGSIFLKKENNKTKFEKRIFKKLFLFFKAYLLNLRDSKEILKKRKERNKDISIE